MSESSATPFLIPVLHLDEEEDDEDDPEEDDDFDGDDEDDEDEEGDEEEPETWQVRPASYPALNVGSGLTSGIDLPRLAGIFRLS